MALEVLQDPQERRLTHPPQANEPSLTCQQEAWRDALPPGTWSDLLELMCDHGFAGMAQARQRLLNEALQREPPASGYPAVRGARPCERTPLCRGQACRPARGPAARGRAVFAPNSGKTAARFTGAAAKCRPTDAKYGQTGTVSRQTGAESAQTAAKWGQTTVESRQTAAKRGQTAAVSAHPAPVWTQTAPVWTQIASK